MNVASREMEQKKKAIYSEEFQAMLDKLEEEDYADNRLSSGIGNYEGEVCMRKSRLCIEQVKALERHFEEDNKLQPERKVKIAKEVGLDPRQVAIWFQNRRARWKSRQLEREYNKLRASYDSLKHDYGSLEQEKLALLSQLKDLKARIEAKTLVALNSGDISNIETTSTNVPLSVSSSSSSSHRTFDPFPFAARSFSDDFNQPNKPNYQNCSVLRIEEASYSDMFSNYEEQTCNIFSVDQAPSLQWYHGDQFNN